jgi:hypothetical protein
MIRRRDLLSVCYIYSVDGVAGDGPGRREAWVGCGDGGWDADAVLRSQWDARVIREVVVCG